MARLSRIVKTEAYRIVYWQLIVITGLALVLLLLKGLHSGLSAFLGGLAYGLPNLAFVWRVFDHAGAQAASRFVIAFVLGEAFKLFISAILFVLIIKYLSMSALYTLIGFCGAIIAFWVVSFWFGMHERGNL